MNGTVRAFPALLLVLVSCAGVSTTSDSIGPPADVAVIRTYEDALSRSPGETEHSAYPSGIVVDDDVAVATVAGGEGGWVTTIFRKRNGTWRAIADKPDAPGPCLFQLAKVDADRERRLMDELIKIAPGHRAIPEDRPLRPDPHPVSCMPPHPWRPSPT